MNVLVTGSARGLGLELVKQLALINEEKGGGLVIATGRKASPELEKFVAESNGSAIFVALDVANEETVVQSAKDVKAALKGQSLDIVINCAGAHGETKGKLAEMSDLDFQLSVNVSGAHKVIKEYLPLMGGSSIKKVANISSIYGSIASAEAVSFAPCPAYKISKAALNALTVQYALSYRDEGFVFFSVHPGWLKSDMGGQDADLTVPQGAEAVLNIVMSTGKEDNGHFKNINVAGWEQYNGMDLPW